MKPKPGRSQVNEKRPSRGVKNKMAEILELSASDFRATTLKCFHKQLWKHLKKNEK